MSDITEDSDPVKIVYDPTDGSLSVENVLLQVKMYNNEMDYIIVDYKNDTVTHTVTLFLKKLTKSAS